MPWSYAKVLKPERLINVNMQEQQSYDRFLTKAGVAQIIIAITFELIRVKSIYK